MAIHMQKQPPTAGDLRTYYYEWIGQLWPEGLIPPEADLHYVAQMLFGSPAVMEHRYRVHEDVDTFICEAPEGHFAIGFWGHGIQSHAFYVQRVEPWCRVYLRLPFGGAYSDNKLQASHLHRVLLWLPDFLWDARRQCRHLQLVDSMGGGYLKMEAVDGERASLQCSAKQLASKGASVEDIFALRFSNEYQVERWLTNHE